MRSISNVDITTSLLALKGCVISRIHTIADFSPDTIQYINSSIFLSMAFHQRIILFIPHTQIFSESSDCSFNGYLTGISLWVDFVLSADLSGGSLCIKSYNQSNLVAVLMRLCSSSSELCLLFAYLICMSHESFEVH